MLTMLVVFSAVSSVLFFALAIIVFFLDKARAKRLFQFGVTSLLLFTLVVTLYSVKPPALQDDAEQDVAVQESSFSMD